MEDRGKFLQNDELAGAEQTDSNQFLFFINKTKRNKTLSSRFYLLFFICYLGMYMCSMRVCVYVSVAVI